MGQHVSFPPPRRKNEDETPAEYTSYIHQYVKDLDEWADDRLLSSIRKLGITVMIMAASTIAIIALLIEKGV